MTPNQIELGEWSKQAGIQRVTEHTPESWKEAFRTQALLLLNRQGSVTSGEVTALIGLPPAHRNAIGAAMHAFATEFKLSCQYEKSERSSRHRAIIGRWFRTESPSP